MLHLPIISYLPLPFPLALWSGGDLAGWVKFIIAMSVIIVVACVCCCVCYAVTRAETPAADQQPVELYNRRETATGVGCDWPCRFLASDDSVSTHTRHTLVDARARTHALTHSLARSCSCLVQKEQFEKPEVTKVGGGTGDDDLPAYEDVV